MKYIGHKQIKEMLLQPTRNLENTFPQEVATHPAEFELHLY